MTHDPREVPQITMADIRKHTGEGMVSEQSVIDAANEVLKEIYTSPPPAEGWNEAQTRRMFEAEFAKNLDLTEDKDAWGQPKFKHSHVDALYEGWRRAIESLRRESPAPDGVADSDLDAEIAALAHKFWSIHPSSLDDMGLTREQFYAQEMSKLIKAVRG